MAATLDQVVRRSIDSRVGCRMAAERAHGVRHRAASGPPAARPLRGVNPGHPSLARGGSVDFDGAHFQLADARCDPAPRSTATAVARRRRRRAPDDPDRCSTRRRLACLGGPVRVPAQERCPRRGVQRRRQRPGVRTPAHRQVLLVTTDGTIGADGLPTTTWWDRRPRSPIGSPSYRDAGVDEFIIRDHRASPLRRRNEVTGDRRRRPRPSPALTRRIARIARPLAKNRAHSGG